MLEKLRLVEERYMEMAERAGQPDFYADPKAASKLLREQKRLEPIVTAYRSFCKAKKEADELRSKVKAMMDKKHLEEMDVGNFTVRYTTVVSSRFDSRAFQETHQALYDQYCVASESKRFTIS